MPVVTKEKYNRSKIDKLSDYIRLYNERGQPIDYEILVDNFKAVRRTNDPEMFSMFDNYINADTNSVEVLLYTGNSNNNDKHIFFFGDAPRDKQSLNGVEVDNLVEEKYDKRKKEEELETLKKEGQQLKEQIADLQKEIKQLEKEAAEHEASQSPLKGILGEIGSSFVESFIRRNPNVIKSIPGGEALAGLMESDAERNAKENQPPEGEVSFHSKNASTPAASLNEEDQAAISFVSQLKGQFTKEEFDKVLHVLQGMAEDKLRIDTILKTINP